MQPAKSVSSTCDNEKHSSHKCQHDDDANGQEGHIGRQGLSDASRPRSFLVQDHINSPPSDEIARAKRAAMLYFFAASRRDVARASRPRPNIAMLAGSGTAAVFTAKAPMSG